MYLNISRTAAGRSRLISAIALLVAVAVASAWLLAVTSPARAAGTEVKVTSNAQLGDILTDAAGRTLYLFTRDRRLESNCSGGCLGAWPPLLTEDPPAAGAGVDEGRLGTIPRSDGTLQVAYNGWPLYYWRDDVNMGDTGGQDRGGFWFVVSPFGSAVHTSAKITMTNDATLGDIITDDSGRALYLFKRDERDTVNCNGRCALAWTPLLTVDSPVADGGLNADRVGTVTRDDGSTQVTYNGWPLYYFARDGGPGDTGGQEVGRIWYVVSSHGAAIHTVAPLNLAEDSEFGAILADRSGRTLYLFDRDVANVSNCNGNCALAWPPFLTTRAPIDIGGVENGALGAITRDDGYKQVTYNGRPLYYFANDVRPGDTGGQTIGTVWWVLDASGNKITGPTTSTTAESAITVADGGTLRSRDGSVSVTLSAGDLAADATVRLSPAASPSSTTGATDFRPAASGMALSLHDATGAAVPGRLSGPAEVCLSYSQDDAAGSATGAFGLRVMQFNQSANYWVALTTQLDLVNGRVCAHTRSQGTLTLGLATR